jgi:hypothetical protein
MEHIETARGELKSLSTQAAKKKAQKDPGAKPQGQNLKPEAYLSTL